MSLTDRIATLEADRQAAVADGAAWAEIARALGASTQAVPKRYRGLRHSPCSAETWHEPPLSGSR